MASSIARPHLRHTLFGVVAFGLAISASASETRPALAAYTGPPPAPTLSAEEQHRIAAGRPVFKTFAHHQDVRALAAFRVDAPPHVVWSVVTDFDKYPRWIKGVAAARVYRRDSNRVHVMFDVNHWFVGRYVYHIEHTLKPSNDAWITWRLDRGLPSDFEDTVGFWRISGLDATTSLVTYSATLRLDTWVPGFIERQLIRGTLKQATEWVRSQSEIRVGKRSGNGVAYSQPGERPTEGVNWHRRRLRF